MSERQRLRYVAVWPDGRTETVILEVPWGAHTGRIPPPSINFALPGRVDGQTVVAWQYTYQGAADE